MIICPSQGFAFVHIPKNAGTSVRTQILKCDEAAIEMGLTGTHPVLGKVDFGHIPLDLLQEHFPDNYAYLEKLPSFAIVRDPLDRFGSAFRQVLWQYEQRPMTLIPKEEVRQKALEMLDVLEGQVVAPDHQHVFFTRQERFIFNGDTQVVTYVVPMALVPQLIGYWSQQTGVPMETGVKANQNVELKYKGIGGLAYGINGLMRRVLPIDLHNRIKDTALKVLASGKNAAQESGVLDIPEVQDFVARHYARDMEIFRAVEAQSSALEEGLASGDLPRQVL